MSSKITGKEYPLLKIFSSDFEYHIPPYQRPYAWTKEETGVLFDDLYSFYQTEQEDNYFLGTIVLIKDDDKPLAEVIDGQQRLTEEEKKAFLKALNGEIYMMPSRRRNYIIQRLDSSVSDGAARYDSRVFSIEHVLPQNPQKGSEWEKLWTDSREREEWLNRIANLVPLTRQRNSQAQNYDFATANGRREWTTLDGRMFGKVVGK